jgi:hypothetical protein
MIRSDKGQVLVLLALAIFALLALAALGIDVGYMYSVRHELQRSADTGALAGASKFLEPYSFWSSTYDLTMQQADTRARDFASKDNVVGSPLDRNAPEVVVTFPSEGRVRVDTQRTAPLFFARVLGQNSKVIKATAVAEAAVADQDVQCLQPWAIPKPLENDIDGDGLYDPALGEKTREFAEGETIILKVAEPRNSSKTWDDLITLQQEAGHFFGLAMCGDTGANAYNSRIVDPCRGNCGIDNGEYVPLEPGNMVEKTKKGVDALMAADPLAQWVGPPLPGSDPTDLSTWVTGSKAPGGWQKSARLVRIPIYDPEILVKEGRTEVKIVGFAAFWLEGYMEGQGTVTGRFVSMQVKGSSTSGPAPGVALRILRLVE